MNESADENPKNDDQSKAMRYETRILEQGYWKMWKKRRQYCFYSSIDNNSNKSEESGRRT